eukprot:NODE_8154_length_422_cov_24.375335_g7288_i0.p2 GENE.NODE_8154_length_422_cov_24.375335_g7288_i0~~NODE_8154_length_422_cov_24.375335_g7288_i0.p2  ORF type:complete len:63 (+),score=0.20 NODE_8154_length_422_cov_24.375335_g7288_i0:84-272(+)
MPLQFSSQIYGIMESPLLFTGKMVLNNGQPTTKFQCFETKSRLKGERKEKSEKTPWYGCKAL